MQRFVSISVVELEAGYRSVAADHAREIAAKEWLDALVPDFALVAERESVAVLTETKDA